MGTITKRTLLLSAVTAAGIFGFTADDPEPKINHSECSFFGPERERIAAQARERFKASAVTEQVSRMLGRKDRTEQAPAPDPASSGNLIDKHIFGTLKSAGVTPADRTTDYEFIRRVTLDLTGRIPTPDRVQTFIDDKNTNKRSALVDELLSKPEWIDKWTMYYGDKLKNTSQKTAVRMYDDGRNAFYQWIRDSLTNKKPYDQFVREIISAKGTNSYDPAQAPINWLVGGRVMNGPIQDIWDQQAANIAETFLGLANTNCILCHNGRGHLDQINLWGRNTSRYQGWQLSSFLSHTNETATRVDPAVNNSPQYWAINDNVQYKSDYPLNTTTGNRPSRQPVGTERNVPPVYFFTGDKPASGENYRDALARFVTGDFQFARATVNYIWTEFFNRGIVSPTNQFDLMRLDPDNPPPDPWTLQPSHPQLLKELAQDFIDHGYDIRYLMKEITTSEAYQLSSRYNGNWDPTWEPLFARHLVRRLWGEEVMDALAQSSNIIPTYNVNGFGKFNWAMQAPEPRTILNNVLSAFMPGNRDDQDRKTDGAVQQALAMMNDPVVMTRTRGTGTGAAASLLAKGLLMQPGDMVDMLYLNVLSRPASDAEKQSAMTYLGTGNRQQKAEDLLWALYNKVDFLYNY